MVSAGAAVCELSVPILGNFSGVRIGNERRFDRNVRRCPRTRCRPRLCSRCNRVKQTKDEDWPAHCAHGEGSHYLPLGVLKIASSLALSTPGKGGPLSGGTGAVTRPSVGR